MSLLVRPAFIQRPPARRFFLGLAHSCVVSRCVVCKCLSHNNSFSRCPRIRALPYATLKHASRKREAERRQAHHALAASADAAAIPAGRSPLGAPPRRLPRKSMPWLSPGRVSCDLHAAGVTRRTLSQSSEAPRGPVLVPAETMPEPPGSGVTSPARGNRTRPVNRPSPVTSLRWASLAQCNLYGDIRQEQVTVSETIFC